MASIPPFPLRLPRGDITACRALACVRGLGLCRRLSPTGGCCSSDAIKRFEIRGDLGGIRIEKPFDCDLEGFLSRTIAGNAECQDLDFADLAEAGFVFAELDVCFADGFLDSVLSADFAAGFAAVLALAFGEDFADDFPAGFAVVFSVDLAALSSVFFAVLFAVFDDLGEAVFAAGFLTTFASFAGALTAAEVIGSSTGIAVSSASPWLAAAKQIAVLMIQIRFKNMSVSWRKITLQDHSSASEVPIAP